MNHTQSRPKWTAGQRHRSDRLVAVAPILAALLSCFVAFHFLACSKPSPEVPQLVSLPLPARKVLEEQLSKIVSEDSRNRLLMKALEVIESREIPGGYLCVCELEIVAQGSWAVDLASIERGRQAFYAYPPGSDAVRQGDLPVDVVPDGARIVGRYKVSVYVGEHPGVSRVFIEEK